MDLNKSLFFHNPLTCKESISNRFFNLNYFILQYIFNVNIIQLNLNTIFTHVINVCLKVTSTKQATTVDTIKVN